VAPLVAVALLLVGVVGLGLVRVAAAAARLGAAQAAADAVALAGAADGPDAADTVAAANDARVEAYRSAGGDVVVTVERRGHRATARARWVPDEVAARPPPERPPTV
jgi:hypothetical protein